MSTTKKGGFTAEEKAAMRARAREQKANEDGEKAVAEAIAKMSASDRALAQKVHELVKAAAPALTPKTWYGMPAYANAAGKVVVYFRDAGKFKSRYATLGFSDSANLDDGSMWPTDFAVAEITPAVGKRISALVKQAVS